MHHLLTPETLRLTMGLAFFPLGLFSVIAGLLILVAGPYRQEAKVLAQQSARIGAIRSRRLLAAGQGLGTTSCLHCAAVVTEEMLCPPTSLPA
jgi:hypothetical protein